MIEILKIVILLAVLVSMLLSGTHKEKVNYVYNCTAAQVPESHLVSKDTKTSFHLAYFNNYQKIKSKPGLNL